MSRGGGGHHGPPPVFFDPPKKGGGGGVVVHHVSQFLQKFVRNIPLFDEFHLAQCCQNSIQVSRLVSIATGAMMMPHSDTPSDGH